MKTETFAEFRRDPVAVAYVEHFRKVIREVRKKN